MMGKENELFLNISISGIRYTLYKEDVRRYPSTLLAELADWNPWTTDGMPKRLPYGFHHNPSSNEFYLMRSPKLFEMILYYYATGQFHVPSEVCYDLIEEELSFWKLDKVIFAPCCKDRDTRPEILSVSESDTTSSSEFYGDNWRKRTWIMFEDPNSSWKAKLIMMITVFFTTISIANMIAGSLPSLQFCSEEFEQAHNNLSVRFYLESMELYSHCRGTLVFGTVDALCTIWFTIEFIMRFFVSSNKFKFMNNAMNIIDLLSALPFFFELIIWAILQEDMHTYNSHTVIVILRLLRFLRIARLLKMCKYSDDLQILYGTFNMARRELLMLTIFTSFGLLIFATLLYYIEKDEKDTNFSSIPASCWWAIVTLTTAGYGVRLIM